MSKSKTEGYFQTSFEKYLSIAAPLVRNFWTKSRRSWHKETGLQRLSQILGKQNKTGVTCKRHFAQSGLWQLHQSLGSEKHKKENISFAQCQYSNQYSLLSLDVASMFFSEIYKFNKLSDVNFNQMYLTVNVYQKLSEIISLFYSVRI